MTSRREFFKLFSAVAAVSLPDMSQSRLDALRDKIANGLIFNDSLPVSLNMTENDGIVKVVAKFDMPYGNLSFNFSKMNEGRGLVVCDEDYTKKHLDKYPNDLVCTGGAYIRGNTVSFSVKV